MQDYNICKLSDVIDFNPKEKLSKGSLAKKVSMDKLQPYTKVVSSFDIAKYNGGAKFRNGDTIMARITPCLENGKTSFVDFLDDKEVAFGSTEFIVMRAKEGITDSQYIYYLATSPEIRKVAIQSMVGSSGRQRVQQGVINEYEIALPPLEEQKRIAAILSALDDKIEINRKINENLEQQAQALYQQIFVETQNEQRYVCRADDCFDISIGKTPPRKESQWFSTNSSDYVWVSISDMGNCGLYIADSSEYLTKEAVDKFNIKLVPDNTVILSFKLTVGRVAITDGEMVTNEAIAHFKTDKKNINEYLYCYLRNFNFQTMGSTSSIATAVNSKIVKGMPFIVPADKELAIFHSFATPLFALIKYNLQENVKLFRLRDMLLPKLMSGEIDVNNI